MGYTEIEFVCVNNSCAGSTSPEAQDRLYSEMSLIPDLLVYRQDWSEDAAAGQQQVSMAAVLLRNPEETRSRGVALAALLGVAIDLENDVPEEKLVEILEGTLEALKDSYRT